MKDSNHFSEFERCLEKLMTADPKITDQDDFYRAGVIDHFNLAFELAWKALKESLLKHGFEVAKTGSPRSILKEGYRVEFVNNAEIWLDMLERRNVSVHDYDKNISVILSKKILSEYIPAFVELRDTLLEKNSELGSNWNRN